MPLIDCPIIPKKTNLMKNLPKVLIALIYIAIAQIADAQISGTVFRDINSNGTRQVSSPIEPGEFGIVVNAYNAANTLIATRTTDANGSYAFPASGANSIASGTAVRLEFIAGSGNAPSKRMAAGNSNVQFTVAGAAVIADYAIASRDLYTNTSNPYAATNGSTNGDALGGGTAGTNNNLYIFPYDMSSAGTQRRPNSEIGSVFSLTWQPESRTLLMAAFLKRHAGFGPNGIGAIYKNTVTAAGVPAATSLLVNVSAIGINVGTNPRSAALPAASNTPNTDPGVFAEVGKEESEVSTFPKMDVTCTW